MPTSLHMKCTQLQPHFHSKARSLSTQLQNEPTVFVCEETGAQCRGGEGGGGGETNVRCYQQST